MTWQSQQQNDAGLLREMLDSVMADQQRIAEIVTSATSLTIEDMERMFRKAETKTAAEAVDVGIAHEVREVEIPQGAPFISLVFNQ